MKVHCPLLGFSIDREAGCTASGNHPLCRKCRGEAGVPSVERKAKKHCGRCGKVFSRKSNAEKYCEWCRKWAYRDKARAWDRGKRENGSQSAKTGGLINWNP